MAPPEAPAGDPTQASTSNLALASVVDLTQSDDGRQLDDGSSDVDDILDPHILGEDLSDDFLQRQISQWKNLSDLQVPLPSSSGDDMPPNWDAITYPMKAIIIKKQMDLMQNSFQSAVEALCLTRPQVDAFLRRHRAAEPSLPRPYYLSKEELAYGTRFVDSHRIESNSKMLDCFAENNKISPWPIKISHEDYDPNRLDPAQPNIAELCRNEESRFDNLSTQGVRPPGTQYVALAFQIGNPSKTHPRIKNMRILYFQLPAGAVVVSPRGIMTLPDPGRYTVKYPPQSLNTAWGMSKTHQFLVCKEQPAKSPAPWELDDFSINPVVNQHFVDAFDDPVLAVERAEENCLINTNFIGPSSASSYIPPGPEQDYGQGPQEPFKASPGNSSLEIADMYKDGFRALLQFRLPDGCKIQSPSGLIMNFTTGDTGWTCPPCCGGDYMILPASHKDLADNYKTAKLDDTTLVRAVYLESMLLYRDGIKISQLTKGGGPFQLSVKDTKGSIAITDKDGKHEWIEEKNDLHVDAIARAANEDFTRYLIPPQVNPTTWIDPDKPPNILRDAPHARPVTKPYSFKGCKATKTPIPVPTPRLSSGPGPALPLRVRQLLPSQKNTTHKATGAIHSRDDYQVISSDESTSSDGSLSSIDSSSSDDEDDEAREDTESGTGAAETSTQTRKGHNISTAPKVSNVSPQAEGQPVRKIKLLKKAGSPLKSKTKKPKTKKKSSKAEPQGRKTRSSLNTAETPELESQKQVSKEPNLMVTFTGVPRERLLTNVQEKAKNTVMPYSGVQTRRSSTEAVRNRLQAIAADISSRPADEVSILIDSVPNIHPLT